VTNLLENAVKYTPPGTPIEARVERVGGRVLIAVADHGPGIPAARRETVFDKFYRLERRGTIKGSGLGLAVSKGLVEGHGGRIWVAETPGGGATFAFELPIQETGPIRPPAVDGPIEPAAGPAPAGAAGGSGGRRA
jgi:signal transduction histidine kinase